MMKRFFALGSLAALLAACTPSTTLLSPDGRNSVAFDAATMTYAVMRDGDTLIRPSALGIETREAQFADFEVARVRRASADETWTQPWGENKTMRDRHNEMAVEMRSADGRVRLTLRFRAFDDGVGFRYEWQVPDADSLTVTAEKTEFRFAADGDSWTIPASFETYELLYRKLPLAELTDANTPATFRVGDVYGSIHEAALYDYPEMTLRKTGELAFASELAPLPDGSKARVPGSFVTPWRTIQLGDRAVDLINSSLILNLNEPSKIEDTSWIRPMKYVGVWWGMHLGIESWSMDDRHGATTENAKRYIDFAAANNIQGVLFEGWNEGWESWGGRQAFDFTKPYADFDVAEIVRYARERGIEVINHHETGGNIPNYERQLEHALAWSAEQGMRNLKTGYAGGFPDGYLHHSQYGVRHYQKVVEAAAAHRITVNAHEPIKDCGIRRTWPNMMTRSYGCGDARCAGGPPSHGVMLPFTRLLAGPMGCASGTFDILSECARDSVRFGLRDCMEEAGMRVNSTLAGQIADWVILYSPLQMASDRIEHYEGHPAFRFFRDFDPDCDWSRALAGEPGEYVVVVRRAGDRFYFGAATNERPRTLHFELDFLEPEVTYEAAIYADAPDADWRTDPTACDVSVRYVTSADAIDVVLAPGGGQAISFLPL